MFPVICRVEPNKLESSRGQTAQEFKYWAKSRITRRATTPSITSGHGQLYPHLVVDKGELEKVTVQQD